MDFYVFYELWKNVLQYIFSLNYLIDDLKWPQATKNTWKWYKMVNHGWLKSNCIYLVVIFGNIFRFRSIQNYTDPDRTVIGPKSDWFGPIRISYDLTLLHMNVKILNFTLKKYACYNYPPIRTQNYWPMRCRDIKIKIGSELVMVEEMAEENGLHKGGRD